MKIILALDANTDEVTQRSFKYRRDNVYDTHFAGHNVTQFVAVPPPIRKLVMQEAKKPGLQFITGAGHGNDSVAYTGNSGEVLYQVDEYEAEEVSGKIVHLLSCGIGTELGQDMVNKGCRAFFGYSENFSLKDEAADVFLECDAAIDIGFIEGLTAKEVYERVVALFNQKIELLRQNQQFYAAIWLRFNRDSLCAPSVDSRWGDENASL